MTTRATTSEAVSLSDILAPVTDGLARVEESLGSQSDGRYRLLSELGSHVLASRGKRLRPALVLLSGAYGECPSDDLVKLATIVELLHTATLIHDDIIDDAEIRRTRATVNAKWDDEIAVIFGDFLFAGAFSLISTFRNPLVSRVLSGVTSDLCKGELWQLQDRFGRSLPSEERYLSMIRLKTATFLAACCQLGAVVSGRSEDEAGPYARYGLNLGMAFQIVDDCLDVVGEEGRMGKSLGTDITTGKITLPFLRLLEELPAQERETLVRDYWANLGDAAFKNRVQALLASHRAIDSTYRTAAGYGDIAKGEIAETRAPYRTQMMALTGFLLARKS